MQVTLGTEGLRERARRIEEGGEDEVLADAAGRSETAKFLLRGARGADSQIRPERQLRKKCQKANPEMSERKGYYEKYQNAYGKSFILWKMPRVGGGRGAGPGGPPASGPAPTLVRT